MAPPAVSVVIATRNRPDALRRCLAALAAQDANAPFEVVVVDDGSVPPVRLAGAPPGVSLVRTGGRGPAAARNLGVRQARAAVIAFTDDDTIPAPGWVRAVVEHLGAHPHHVGVEGPVGSRSWDHLYEHSVATEDAGHRWTCNVAYARSAFEQVGGFREGVFPYPHGEDRDLGLRVGDRGTIGFARSMRVEHVPHAVSAGRLIRQGRWVTSELELRRRHAALPSSRLPLTLPIALDVPFGVARTWQRAFAAERRSLLRSPRRLGRFVLVAGGQTAVTTACALRWALTDARR